MVKNRNGDESHADSVEKVLEPLVSKISTLISKSDSADRPKGLSKNRSTILELIKNTISELVKRAEDITSESPDMVENFQVALSEVQEMGSHFYDSVSNFLEHPVDEDTHTELISASRSLLSSVTRILILADLVDVSQLHSCLESVKGDAECIGILDDEGDLPRMCSLLDTHFGNLQALLKYRNQDLLDSPEQNDLSVSYAALSIACKMVVVTTKASFRYRDLATLAANREFAVQLVGGSVYRLGCACDATYAPIVLPPLQGQSVSRIMQEILKSAAAGVEKTESWNSVFFRSSVQKLSTEIAALTKSAGLANSFQTELKRLNHELSETVDQFIEAWDYETANELQQLVAAMDRICVQIRSLISRGALNLASAAFVSNETACTQMGDAAKCSNEESLVAAVTEIQQQTSDLLDSALCLCGISMDSNAVRFVRLAAKDLEQLAPQLINASKALALRSASTLTKENFTLFLNAYKSLVRILCDSIDRMTCVTDFIEANDAQLQEDIQACLSKAEAGQTSSLVSVSRIFSTRSSRAVNYLLAKLGSPDKDGASIYQTQAILENIQEQLIPHFIQATRDLCRSLHARNGSAKVESMRRSAEAIRSAFSSLKPLVGADFIEATETPSMLEDETFETKPPTPSLRAPPPPPSLPPPPPNAGPPSEDFDPDDDSVFRASRQTSRRSLSPIRVNGTNAVLAEIVSKFERERGSLVRRVDRMRRQFDESLLSLVQRICGHLDEVIDYVAFTGKSPISDDNELVQVTREISLLTAQLNGSCEEASRGAVNFQKKKKLFASLKNINLFSHELAVMSRVKADMKIPSSEISLDNAISVVHAGRSLLQSVSRAIAEFRAIGEQKRDRSASSVTLPPLPPRRQSFTLDGVRRRGLVDNSTPSLFTVQIDKTYDFSY